MDGLFRFVDPEDETVVRLDMNTLGNGAATGLGLLGNVNLGTVAPHEDTAEFTFNIWALGNSYEQLRGYAHALLREVDRGGVVEMMLGDATSSRYIDVDEGVLGTMFRGDERGINKIVELWLDNVGIPVVFRRQRYLRGEPLDPEVFTIGNDSTGRDFIITNPGNAPALMKLEIVPEAPSKVMQVRIATKSTGNLSDFSDIYVIQCEDIMDATDPDTSSVVETGTLGGSVAKTDFDTTPWMRRRLRGTLTASLLNGLRGKYMVYAVMRATDPETEFDVQLRWANGDREVAEITNRRIEFDASDIETFIYTEVPLGFVNFKEDEATVELWAKRREGNGGLRFDALVFMPADEYFGTFTVPGLRNHGTNTTRWRGAELEILNDPFPTDETPRVKDDDMRLNKVGERVGNPEGLQAWPAGRHKVRVNVSLQNMDSDDDDPVKHRIVVGEFQLKDGSGVVQKIKLRTRKRRLKTRRKKTLTFDSNGAATRRFVVEMTNDPVDSDAKLTVHSMRHSFQRWAGSTDTIVIDSVRRECYIRDTDGRLSELAPHNGFPRLAPGSNLMMFSLGEFLESGYDDVIESEPLLRFDKAQGAEVTVTLTPRYIE